MRRHSEITRTWWQLPTLVGLLACLLAPAAWALARVELYQATAPLTDRSEAAQTVAFQLAMKTVLVRVTGNRSVEENAALAPLVSNARRYVQQFRAAPDSQLWVAFDGGAIERWLTQNGQPLWGKDRPATLVLLAAQSGGSGVVVSAEDTSELKQAVDAAALARGLPLIWPAAAELQRNRIDYSAVVGGSPAGFAELARRLNADGVLVGRAGGTSATAAVRWTHQFQEHNSEFSGLAEGVNRTADQYASLFAASGALAPVEIEVAGIADVKDYANVETLLESQTFISHVGVESLTGDTVRFRLATRGGGESLQRALAIGGKLKAVPGGENGVQRFQLRH